MSCNSSSKQIQKEWKKANAVLTLKFKEYTDINETLVSKIVDMRNDAILNKSALLQLLQDYLSNLQECCASLGSKIDDTIYYFENMPCLCPPTTTTTEAPIFTTTGTEPPTPTTTPTPDECNTPTYVDEKGSFYPYIVTKYLGTDLGLVTLTFNTYDIPDRIVVEWDSNDVIDTGYHGLVKFQAKLNAAVAVYGDVAGAINPAQTGTISFIKDNANEWAIVKVYAPLNNTRFEFTLSCPQPFETTTTTTENCWNWILTDIANDGNWTYFDVEYCNGSSEIIALRNGQIRVVCLSNAISFNPLRGTAVNTELSCNTTTTTTEEDVTTTTEYPCDLVVVVIDPVPATTTTTTEEPVTTTSEEPFTSTTTAEPCLFPPDYDVEATLFMTVISPPLGIFSGSFVNACNALYGFNNLGYTIAPGYYAISKRHGFNDYWRIGDFVFDTEECSLVPSGYYIVQVPGQDSRVIYIVDGEIISYPECPEETTTTTTCEECDTEKYSLIVSVMNNTIDVDLRVLDVEGSVDAWCTWVSEELVNQYGYGLQGTVCGTIEVGQILYIGDKCTLLPTGSYIYDPNFVVDTETLHTHFNVNVLEIVDGEIMSITPTNCETTTTTTEEQTTTTTEPVCPVVPTDTGAELLPSGSEYYCDPDAYPYTDDRGSGVDLISPLLVGTCFPPYTWEDVEYMEIMSVSRDPGITLKYNGVTAATGIILRPSTQDFWQYHLTGTRDAFGCNTLSETWTVRVKLYGFQISEEFNIFVLWNLSGCDDCLNTTTTTTPIP